ncbi:hypothetical protein QFC24_004779 [Naganishia onofrii]|uniref:Uncharacterized protein n=1 Tax=Naganishia onofrii TaxID=1851511 RepID=A0ACC2XDI4_9TREE|nr:hypothetical protein QFC24_004779 [Naganishia onofrii]
MGGLLIADAAIGIALAGREHDDEKTTTTQPRARQGQETWPRIVALVAFDTPYLGLNPSVFKNSITKYAGHVELAKNVVGGLGGLGLGGGAVWGLFGGGGGAAGADTRGKDGDGKPAERDEKPKGRTTRNSSAAAAAAAASATTSQPTPPPPTSSSSSSSWTLPAIPSFKTLATAASAAAILTTTAAAAYYKREDLVGGWTWVSDHAVWLRNLWDSSGMRERLSGIQGLRCGGGDDGTGGVEDEVQAHIGMFNPGTHEGFYNLGLEVARDVEEALERDAKREREVVEEEEADFLVG